MNKTVYLPYKTVRESTRKIVARQYPKKERKKRRDTILKDAIRKVLLFPGMLQTMEANILMDEEAYVERGCRMYFPESAALLEMLWGGARMDLDLADLDMDRIPPVFSVAWPKCEIDGAQMRGCLVVIMTGNQYNELCSRFGRRYLGSDIARVKLVDRIPDDILGLHLTYWQPQEKGDPMLVRCCVPDTGIKECFSSESGYREFMESFGNLRLLGAVGLDEQETHQNYVMSKLVLRLMVYMQACPEHVHYGLPDGHKDRDFKSPYEEITTCRVGVPAGLVGTYASPSVHWRTWHFRSYPVRKNGTKRKGAVFVKGTVVNADVDPQTVEDETTSKRTETFAQGVVHGHR